MRWGRRSENGRMGQVGWMPCPKQKGRPAERDRPSKSAWNDDQLATRGDAAAPGWHGGHGIWPVWRLSRDTRSGCSDARYVSIAASVALLRMSSSTSLSNVSRLVCHVDVP